MTSAKSHTTIGSSSTARRFILNAQAIRVGAMHTSRRRGHGFHRRRSVLRESEAKEVSDRFARRASLLEEVRATSANV